MFVLLNCALMITILLAVCMRALTIQISKVVVVGGGFGGLYTALSAAEKCPELEITLIDKKESFVFLPLLYDLVTGTASEKDVTPLYDFLLSNHRNVKFVQGAVTSADFEKRELLVTTKDGDSSELSYDQLVLATGSLARLVVPGAAENAIPFYTAEDAERLRGKLQSALSEAVCSGQDYVRVVVVGGGYSGVEIATSVADYLGKGKAVVTIVDRNDMILPSSPVSTRNTALRCFVPFRLILILYSTIYI
jgi:demethylphylloquinone reductase